jgi:hypothetical protein
VALLAALLWLGQHLFFGGDDNGADASARDWRYRFGPQLGYVAGPPPH